MKRKKVAPAKKSKKLKIQPIGQKCDKDEVPIRCNEFELFNFSVGPHKITASQLALSCDIIVCKSEKRPVVAMEGSVQISGWCYPMMGRVAFSLGTKYDG